MSCHAANLPAGGFGKLVYSEGEYYHYSVTQIPSFRNWRVGVPPQWYPTHATAYYVCVSGGTFTDVTCMGMPSIIKELQPANNRYKNPFGTEIALFRTSEGGMSRMGISWDTFVPGKRDRPCLRSARLHGRHEIHRPRSEAPDLERPACRQASIRAATAVRTVTS